MMIKGKINILLADDDKDDILLFTEALEELAIPCNFSTVSDGQKLMQLLAKNVIEFPHVLFLDLNMPRKNGFACLTEIKSDEKLKHLPVVIFSTSFDDQVAERLYHQGAYYYICKPADFTQLKKIIKLILELIQNGNYVQPSKEKFLLSTIKTVLL